MKVNRSSVVAFAGGLLMAMAPLLAQDIVPTVSQAAPAPPARKLSVTFKNGLVTVAAQGVSVRDVLIEWGKACECTVVGIDKITNAQIPGPVLYENQPEEAVLKSLLNASVSGNYMQTPRDQAQATGSKYASLLISGIGHASATYSSMPNSPAVTLAQDDELPPVQRVQISDPNANQQPAAPKAPAGPPLPVGVMPAAGLPTTGPGTTAPPPSGGRGGGGR